MLTTTYTYNGLGARVSRELIMQDNTHGYTDFHKETPSVDAGITKAEVVKESYVIDYTSATFDPLTMDEVGGFNYRYVYGLDKLSVKITSEGTNWWGQNTTTNILKDYYHQDRMGSTTNMTDVYGRVVGRADYNEWGQITYQEALSITSSYRRIYPQLSYTGHDWDDVLGMYCAKARFYSADDKRFVAMDPIKGQITDPLSMVSYLYCVDNPLRWVDPLGLDAEAAAAWSGTMWWLTGLDGPLPFGDFIYLVGAVVIGVIGGLATVEVVDTVLPATTKPRPAAGQPSQVTDRDVSTQTPSKTANPSIPQTKPSSSAGRQQFYEVFLDDGVTAPVPVQVPRKSGNFTPVLADGYMPQAGCPGVENQDADELPVPAAADVAGASTPGDPNGDKNNNGNKGKKDPKVEYKGEQRSVYRGGNDLTVKGGEVKINPSTGKVTSARGISVNVDPSAVAKFGGAFRVAWIPAGLEIVQRGLSATHFEIVPAFEMALSEFQALLNQIILLPY